VRKNKSLGRIRTLDSQSDVSGKNVLFGLYFLKHELHLILPMVIQKKLDVVITSQVASLIVAQLVERMIKTVVNL
jgi:hypothetical protein